MLAEGILELEYPILDAFQLAGNIIVLFEPDAKKRPGAIQESRGAKARWGTYLGS